MITLRNMTIRRGANVLLENINWTIYAKQRIGLIGANGSGKSTLFSVLLGQFHGDTGDIDIPKNLCFAHVAQETPSLSCHALDFVLDGDQELRSLEAILKKAENDDNGMLIGDIHSKLAAIDAYTAPSRAATLLHGLGFSQTDIYKEVREFSGGWRVRLNLAKALMCRSDVLLLDEPTNHLDLDAVIWLEEWIKQYPGTLVMISHDRDFLDATVNYIAHLSHRQLKSYTGNYSTFETARAADLLLQQAVYDKQQRQLEHMRGFVERFRYKASKAKQAQSRLKAIERMELVSAVQSESVFQFAFRTPKAAPNPVIALDEVTIGYGDKIIVNNINLSLAPKDRIAILGPNGAGKSTFIKTLATQLAPMHGTCILGTGVKIGYFAQQQIDHLNLAESPIAHLRDLADNTAETDLRTYLGSFGFIGDRVFEPVKHFSGGEKSRLALALITWQKPSLLLLDEPTNHLDLEMRHALSLALQDYSGAMVLVSHDRFLVRSTTDKLLLCANGQLTDFDGDLNDYQIWLQQHNKQSNTSVTSSNQGKKSQRQQAAKVREQRKPLLDKIKQLETQLEKLQKQANEIEIHLTDQSLYEASNKPQLQDYLQKLSTLKSQIEVTEAEWLEACEQRDSTT